MVIPMAAAMGILMVVTAIPMHPRHRLLLYLQQQQSPVSKVLNLETAEISAVSFINQSLKN
jgi:hypothetical protein